MITKLYTAIALGIKTHRITIEIIIKEASRSSFYIVGMGDKAVQESKKRITAALGSVGLSLEDKSIVVNLAPAQLKKVGTAFDFPIALAIMKCLKALTMSDEFIEKTLFIGELALDGSLRGVHNIMTTALDAPKLGAQCIVLPYENFFEHNLAQDCKLVGIHSLKDFVAFFNDPDWQQKAPKKEIATVKHLKDFKEVKSQRAIKRMLQIAVAGNHNAIMVGPPGSGKTMLAQALPSILPDLTTHQKMETTRIYSASPDFRRAIIDAPPFRSPHHGVSLPGMVGGGNPIVPGEISLAHNGVLFLDELTEFRRSVIESLRQPLEDKEITVTRAATSATLPCSFILIASLNPCPCGHLGNVKRSCSCTPLSIYNYLNKISGPFLDRIDLQSFLQSVDLADIQVDEHGWDSETLKQGVLAARKVQKERYGSAEKYNAQLTPTEIDTYCQMKPEAKKLLDFCFDKFQMSMRSYHKIIKVCRTIADLCGSSDIEEKHVKEALMYRGIEQKLTVLKKQL